MLDEEKKLTIEEIKNAQILKIINLATLVSISMLLFYGLGAYKHLKEIKRLN
jgi:multisubunit Na+/H+ antiporter MnhB subunit